MKVNVRKLFISILRTIWGFVFIKCFFQRRASLHLAIDWTSKLIYLCLLNLCHSIICQMVQFTSIKSKLGFQITFSSNTSAHNSNNSQSDLSLIQTFKHVLPCICCK
eukprot:NODE_257_length_11653_cov_0.298858.p11 type:complete len:107 gc:universal NODE_257_length_11653_cov_0.298858:10079-9759(-)